MPAQAAVSLDADAVLRQLEDWTGLALGNPRRRQALAAIARASRNFAIADTQSFLRRLRGDKQLLETMVSAITVGETHFFREPAQIEAIRRKILPDLVQTKPAGLPLRLWSAGCATGEEAYTLAMIVEEAGLSDRATILGTDICETALAKARAAEYGPWSLRHIPDGFLDRFAPVQGGGFTVAEELRRALRFERLNLASDCYPSVASGTAGLDLILCRNVLIYFEKEQVGRVAQRLYHCLRFGGWLVTGPSDPPLWSHAPFETVLVPGAVLYRRNSALGERRRRQVDNGKTTAASSRAMVGQRTRRAVGEPASRNGRLVVPGASSHPARAKPARALLEGEWIAELGRLSAAGDQARAYQAADQALRHFPLSTALHYRRAMILLDLGRLDEATSALRRVLFLDRSLAAAHFALGTVLIRKADREAACRSLERVVRLSRGRPASELVPLCDGRSVQELRDAASAQIEQMRGAGVGR